MSLEPPAEITKGTDPPRNDLETSNPFHFTMLLVGMAESPSWNVPVGSYDIWVGVLRIQGQC
jgi:hypothetical protein